MLGPAGHRGPQCYNLHTYIYIFIFIYTGGWHGAPPRLLNLTRIMHNTMWTNTMIHTGRPGPCLQSEPPRTQEAGEGGCGCWLAGPRGLCSSVPILSPDPASLVCPVPSLGHLCHVSYPPVPLCRVSPAGCPPTEISR